MTVGDVLSKKIARLEEDVTYRSLHAPGTAARARDRLTNFLEQIEVADATVCCVVERMAELWRTAP